MSTSDDDRTDPTLGDTAMASGSDAGSPGEHLGPADLEPDEQRLLDALEKHHPMPGARERLMMTHA